MEEIGWKTGRKDVPENTGSGHPTESGVPAIFTCIGRTRAQDIQKICCFIEQICEEQHTVFCTWKRKTQNLEPEVSGVVSSFSGRQTVYDWHTASFQGRNN